MPPPPSQNHNPPVNNIPETPLAVLSNYPTQERRPLLDVHPPHAPAHTWRDFFIHIATIVIGLLIAIGLEQTVEYFHHRHQIADVREQLDTELKINIATFHIQTLEILRMVPLLQRDLEILQYLHDHPGAPPAAWPGQLSWYSIRLTYVESAWNSAKESQVLALMPRREVQEHSAIYTVLERANVDSEQSMSALWRSLSYSVRNQNPAVMTTTQLEEAIRAVTENLIIYAHMISEQYLLHQQFPVFSPSPDLSDQRRIARVASPQQDQDNARALQKQLNDEIMRIQAQDKVQDRDK
jgi:hypothetical protein